MDKEKLVTLPILTYYDTKVKTWAKSLVDTSISSLGDIFTIKGTLANKSDLPTEGNKVGYVYLVGPLTNNGYEEYLWIDSNEWVLIGNTSSVDPSVDGITKAELYAGNDNTGTPENPAEGTILYSVVTKVQTIVDEIETNELEII